ncbi:hypothetical protein G7K_4613-t1 [Saitoella complicata NRRL Y-17804]|uniref:Protein fyv10 n=1 Tax=Saitoella complicata (strain BCRC 22490 / CBS 7301 / JCM 7358 / NBRC 10748 / NRRL Y-17804) TaxID=698492 RepID=A0A0E9NKX6_SAICN|nr:hypothetical protein G7K_4613-t1 [Saitoella complicata NRRL Y-17804]
MSSEKFNPDNHLILEQPLLKLPHALHESVFRASRVAIDRETTNLTKSIAVVEKEVGKEGGVENALKGIEGMIGRMQGLKRKLGKLQIEEQTILTSTKSRLSYLSELSTMTTTTSPTYDRWNQTRLDRLIIDYMLRQGLTSSAASLAQNRGIEELVDVEVFVKARGVERSLRAERGVGEALGWCGENRKVLVKNGIGSDLEFELRLQEFIELVRADKKLEAIAYYRKHLTPHAATHMPRIQQAAALLAYPPSTTVQPYADLYSDARWDTLADLFVKAHHALYALPNPPLLHVALSAGLSALKTPSCACSSDSNTSAAAMAAAGTNTSTNCPICSPEMAGLAENVPFAHHIHSTLVDTLAPTLSSSECPGAAGGGATARMEGENEPVVLPNGRVYGRRSLRIWNENIGLRGEEDGGRGVVRDPRSGEEFPEDDVRKVFVM